MALLVSVKTSLDLVSTVRSHPIASLFLLYPLFYLLQTLWILRPRVIQPQGQWLRQSLRSVQLEPIPGMTALNLLLFLLFQDLLHLRDDLRKHLMRLFTPHQAPLAGHKKCDYLLFLQFLSL
jgi:hypothetical protein